MIHGTAKEFACTCDVIVRGWCDPATHLVLQVHGAAVQDHHVPQRKERENTCARMVDGHDRVLRQHERLQPRQRAQIPADTPVCVM